VAIDRAQVRHVARLARLALSEEEEERFAAQLGHVLEYVDHLHEHFVDPVTIRGGRYMPPTRPGYSVTMKPESLREYEFPNGSAWRSS